MSCTSIIEINTRSRGEVAFLDQASNIRQVFGEKNVQLTNQNNAGGQSRERLTQVGSNSVSWLILALCEASPVM
jgi:hypothetical protein